MPPRSRKSKSTRTTANVSIKHRTEEKYTDGYGWRWQLFVVILSVVVCATGAVILTSSMGGQHHVLIPFQGPKVLSLEQFSNAEYQNERLWGSYRPHVYFGLRPKIPISVVTGLMWYSHFKGFELRHGCEPHENLQQFGWTRHDGHSFGQQSIVDDGLILTTEFVKIPGPHGGKWTARVSSKWQDGFLNEGKQGPITMFWYTMMEPQPPNSTVRSTPIVIEHPSSNDHNSFSASGFAPGIGPFNTRVSYIDSQSAHMKYWSTVAPNVHQLTDIVRNELVQGYHRGTGNGRIPTLPNTKNPNANMAIVQVTAQVPFVVDITFQPTIDSAPEDVVASPSGDDMTKLLKSREKQFDETFSKTFNIPIEAPARKEAETAVVTAGPEVIVLLDQARMRNDVPAKLATRFEFAKAAFSNLIGSVGYFYGQSEIEGYGTEGKIILGPKQSLLTAVPSRNTFPRGFLWDEGFHQLVIMRWDRQLSKEILGSWLDLMNANGWIAREQVLGAEARSKIPPEYIKQRDDRANPPTFFAAIDEFIGALNKDGHSKLAEEDLAFLNRVYPRLEKWYQWFNTTQSGPLPTSYRWRDRGDPETEMNPKTLTSGLDDFPRSSHPSENERHLDLRCWMLLGSSTMANIASLVGRDGSIYANAAVALNDINLLNELHWSDKLKAYADWGNDTIVRWETAADPEYKQKLTINPSAPKRRTNVGAPEEKFVNHFGYVSLFPFLMGVIPPTSSKLGYILEDIYNPDHLWTEFGLRSLSKSSSLYNVYNTKDDAPYWRGTIWLNINYMAVKALHRYSLMDGPYQNLARKMYRELRGNIIRNMHAEYQRTGYIWEQYDVAPGREGKGRGTKPFSGWSSLVLLIMAELY